MSALYDPEAEQTVAACAAFSSTAALACTDRLTAECFHDPRAWWVIEASLTVPDTRPEHAVAREGWWREHAVALAANVWPAVLEEWCRNAPLAWDADGRMADRVLAAHRHREHARHLLEELEAIGVGVEWKAAS